LKATSTLVLHGILRSLDKIDQTIGWLFGNDGETIVKSISFPTSLAIKNMFIFFGKNRWIELDLMKARRRKKFRFHI
jgi:hypothetical protein